ncbi:Glutamate 5-kinase [Labilithrix luteola]|uniref:Glutamate 5-kinase n=1 Tax=Labilithrix luteola TaxID=1391654 RepID=A0A0K1PT88_9BACT|nr:glutamate 5-kinase [Labilithrix luteola]AKU96601.1 Glutamate 5-kinase [Labilithrix luteola]
MSQARDPRAALRKARRVVVKIGSSSLARDPRAHDRLAEAVSALREEGKQVVIVSSGAIALGTKKLGYRARPKEMARLQAAAAAGQSLLMRAYEEAFGRVSINVAQVLLTHADLADRTRANNARHALSALLDAGCVPILNENDSVSVEEIKFGDNDELSAMVAPLVAADVLVLLSDVEGLLDGQGKRVGVIHDVAAEALPLVRAKKSDVGTGGMASKIEAARRATLAGAHVVIADARREDVLLRIFGGEDEGTVFVAGARRLPAKKHWIAFTLRPRGDLWLDAGAAEAVRSKGRSVLGVGVLGVRGEFRTGDSVRLLAPDGNELGRGLARCASTEAVVRAGKKDENEENAVLVHRDELVVW